MVEIPEPQNPKTPIQHLLNFWMKALILVGGYGTRLRPLTFTVPKPCIEFGNVPIVCHQIKALAEAGVTEIILAIDNKPATMEERMDKYAKDYGVNITYSIEEVPMGTAGPIQLAKDRILADNEEGLFFVFNSDVICEFPIKDLIEFHKAHGGEGTIMTTKVEDPRRFGVVVAQEDGKIDSFVEKPQEFISNNINAGLYLFSTKIID